MENAKTVEIVAAETSFSIPALTAFSETVPGVAVAASVEKLNEFSSQKRAIMDDAHLSRVGRAAKLEPLEKQFWRVLAAGELSIENFSKSIDVREQRLFALYPANTGITAFEQAQDQEIRGWWRGLDRDGRTKALATLRTDAEKFANVILAILRSAIPTDLAEHETILLRELFEKNRRAANLETAIGIDYDRQAYDIGKRAIAQVRGIAYGTTGWNGGRLMEHLLDAKDAESATAIFGAEAVARANHSRRLSGRAAA